MTIYKKLLSKYKTNLVISDITTTINIVFFKELMKELVISEDYSMKHNYNKLLNAMNRPSQELPPSYEVDKNKFEHEFYYSRNNPFYSPESFKIINYNLPHNEWKNQYYSHFFHISKSNIHEFNDYKKHICLLYLQSLVFTIRYYINDVPSWSWYYPYLVAPLPSDILHFLDNAPPNLDFTFKKDKPNTPLEQLCYILPPQSADMLPLPVKKLMTSPSSPIASFFPVDFELDIVSGEKYIYSEPILPHIVSELVDPYLQHALSDLSDKDKLRNTINQEPFIYMP
jgi:5'-3' exonuclease